MAKVDGFDVEYTHRGSWFVYRSYAGEVIDKVPVAWDRDGKPPHVTLGFKTTAEADERLKLSSFVLAYAEKKPKSASAKNIRRLFVVRPIQLVTPHPESTAQAAVRCEVIDKPSLPGTI